MFIDQVARRELNKGGPRYPDAAAELRIRYGANLLSPGFNKEVNEK